MAGKHAAELARELRNTGIPMGRPLLAHVRLRGLAERFSASYADCAAMLLDALRELQPPHLLVPAFTYSFTRSREYDARSTPGEVGRFAEEVRAAHARWRTPDPIFSVTDVLGELAGQGIDYGTAFGKGGLCAWMHERDFLILNFDITPLVLTQVHYVEECCAVPYREHREFPGQVADWEGRARKVNYRFYCRKDTHSVGLDWPHIATGLDERGVLRRAAACGLPVSWVGAQELATDLVAQVRKNPFYLVREKRPR